MNNLNEIFEEALRSVIGEARILLTEDEEMAANQMIISRGAVGSGRLPSELSGRDRSSVDPKGLMEDLGVTGAEGSTDLEKCASIIGQAIKNNKVMAEVFQKPKMGEKLLIFSKSTGKKSKGRKQYIEKKVKVIMIPLKSNVLNYRSGIHLAQAILTGAYNAQMLSLHRPIKFLKEDRGTRVPTFYQKMDDESLSDSGEHDYMDY